MVTGIGSAVRLAGLVDGEPVIRVINGHVSILECDACHPRCDLRAFPRTELVPHPGSKFLCVEVVCTLDDLANSNGAKAIIIANATGVRLWRGNCSKLYRESLTLSLAEQLECERRALTNL